MERFRKEKGQLENGGASNLKRKRALSIPEVGEQEQEEELGFIPPA